jgi:Tol biopolymer transport system component
VIEADGSDELTVFKTSDVVVSSVGPREGRVYARIIARTTTSLEGGQTFAIDVDSGERRPVALEGIPSPDGSHVLVVTDRDMNGPCLFHDCTGYAPEVYVDDVRLTHTTGYEVEPAWSPGGKRIVFARIADDDGDDYELWVMNANGACERQITDNRDWDVSPDWYGSPGTDRPLDC